MAMMVIMASLFIAAVSGGNSKPAIAAGQTVILVHGYSHHASNMKPLADYLASQGFTVVNRDWSYNIDTAGKQIRDVAAGISGPVACVGHSQGGVSCRVAVKNYGVQFTQVVNIDTPQYGPTGALGSMACWTGDPYCGTGAYMKALNTPDETPGNAFWVTMGQTSNTFLPGTCQVAITGDHQTLPANSTVQVKVKDGLNNVCSTGSGSTPTVAPTSTMTSTPVGPVPTSTPRRCWFCR